MQIKDLNPNPRNPRKADQRRLELLAKSLIEFGSLDGFIYNSRTKRLVSAHQRQKVIPNDARIIIDQKYEKPTPQGTIAVGYVEYLGERHPYRQVDWPEEKESAALIAANKGAGEWDLPKLQEFVVELDSSNFDLDLTMFDSDELKNLFGKEFGSDPEKEAIEDEVPETPKEPVSRLGDLYELGEHRLLCGDSTDLKQVELLMDGNLADLWIADPPFGVSYVEKNAAVHGGIVKNAIGKEIKSDTKTVEEIKPLWFGAAKSAYEFTTDEASNYWCACQGSDKMMMMMMMMDEAGWNIRHELIWVKTSFVFGRSDYHYRHEPIIYGWKKKGKHNWYGDRKQSSVFEIDRPHKSDFHPTTKPVELFENFISNSTQSGDKILESFGGSGTTLIASEKLRRKSYTMELDEKYVDTIVSRWCKYTGRTDIKRNGEPMTWTLNT